MYKYKIYDISGAFKTTIPDDQVKSPLAFTANAGGGQGELSVILDRDFEDDRIDNTDIVRVSKDGVLIYSGIIQNIKRDISNTHEELVLPALGLSTMLSYVMYDHGGGYVDTATQDPSQTIKDIIDYFNSLYPTGVGKPNWFTYDGTSIESYGTTVSIDFDHTTCLDAINLCAEATNHILYIHSDGKVYFKPKPNTPTHKLTIGKDIENINMEEDTEELTNKLVLKWKSGTKTYQDAPSQTAYGLREKYVSETSLATEGSADEFGANYIAKNKEPIYKTKITLNKNFNLENIKVGDTIIVKNFKTSITNLQILKYSYSHDKVKLELEAFDSIGKELIT